MQEQNPIVEEDAQSLGMQVVEQKPEKKDLRKDFSEVKMQRIGKLQNILSKNLKLREESFPSNSKEKQKYSFLNIDRPILKRSLPLIKNLQRFENQVKVDKIHINSIFPEKIQEEPSMLKKYRQSLILSDQQTKALIKYQIKGKITEQNPQGESKQAQRSFFKMKVKNLQLEQIKKHLVPRSLKSLKSSISKSSIGISKELIEGKSIIQKSIDKKQASIEKQGRKDMRRKKRNASSLNLTQIEHLPQILFSLNKRCTKSRFPSMSMAQIDHNVLTHEISELEEKRLIEARSREKTEKMFKQKIKSHQRSQMLQSIYLQ